MKPLYTFDRRLFLIASVVVGGYLSIYSAGIVISALSRPTLMPKDEIAKLASEDPIVPAGAVEVAAEREVPIPDLKVDHYCRLRAARDQILPLSRTETRDVTTLYNTCFDQQQALYNAVKHRWPAVSRSSREVCSELSMKLAGTDLLLATEDPYGKLDKCLTQHQADEMAKDIETTAMRAPPRRELQR